MSYLRVKDLREIAKPNGLRYWYRESKKSEFMAGNYLVEVFEDDCKDLTDHEDSLAKKVYVSESGVTIEFCEDNSDDLPDGW